MFKNKITTTALASALVLVVAAATFLGLYYNTPYDSNISTPDEIVATADSATPDTIKVAVGPTMCKETEPETEAPTEPPTEELAEKATESISENIIYTQIDHGSVKNDPVETPTWNSSSNGDVVLLAKVIYLEGGNCSEYCQWLIGSTAMNLADINGGLSAVAYNYNLFNVVYLIDGCTPSQMSLNVAERVLSGDRDYNVKAFRTDYYHSFGTPYTNIDNVYFSSY